MPKIEHHTGVARIWVYDTTGKVGKCVASGDISKLKKSACPFERQTVISLYWDPTVPAKHREIVGEAIASMAQDVSTSTVSVSVPEKVSKYTWVICR